MLFESFMLFLTEKDNSDSFKPNLNPDQYRVSSIPYCNRKAYFVKTGHENRSSNYLSRLASEGKLHHTAAQVDAEEYATEVLGLEVEIEEKLHVSFTPLLKGKLAKPVKVRGSIDLKWVLPAGRHQIVDIKSVGSKGYYNTRNYGAYQSHVDQVLIYDWGYRKTYEPEVSPTTELWYKNRNDGQWLEVHVPYNKERVDFLVEKLCKLIYAVRKQEVPDDHSPMYDYECRSKSGRCPFYSLCYEGDKFKKYNKEETQDE